MGLLKQVYTYTKGSWTPETSGAFFWEQAETEQDYITKMGFQYQVGFANNPNFLSTPNRVTHNDFCQFLIFSQKLDPPPAHNYELICYFRLRQFGQGMFVLIENIADLIFLMDETNSLVDMHLQSVPMNVQTTM